MSVWPLVLRGVDFLLERAIRLDQYLDEKKARKKRGLSFEDVRHQQQQIAAATRAAAKTVVLSRPTSPPASVDGAPPTGSRTPSPRR